MKCYIFADGGDKIGMGHIMRTLPLANLFRNQGHPVVYVTSMTAGSVKVHSEGFQTLTEQEAKADSERLNQNSICIVDRYNVTPEFFRELCSAFSFLAYIDDMNLFDYPVDAIINGTASATDEFYANQSLAPIRLLGLTYNLVDKRFCSGTNRIYRQRPERILVTMGGTDPVNATGQLLRLLTASRYWPDFSLDVVIGKNCPHEKSLSHQYGENQNIRLHKVVDDLNPIMMQCDFAISAGGITLYELIATGLPAVSVVTASNQKMQVEALDSQRILQTLGEIQNIKPIDLEILLKKLYKNYSNWVIEARQSCSIIDGEGSNRIIEKLLKGAIQYGRSIHTLWPSMD